MANWRASGPKLPTVVSRFDFENNEKHWCFCVVRKDFTKANGPMASGGDDDIKMNIEVKPEEMILKWSVGDAPDKSVHFTYDGARENEVRLVDENNEKT